MRLKEHKAAMRRLQSLLQERWEPQRKDEWSFAFPWLAWCIPLACHAKINLDTGLFTFRAINSVPVEPARRMFVAEFIHRLNYDLPIGTWAIDLDRGVVRWTSGIYFLGGKLTENMMRNVIDSSLFVIHRDIIGLAKLQTGGSLEEAMAARGNGHGIGITWGMRAPGVLTS
jgi:hypothetical protein